MKTLSERAAKIELGVAGKNTYTGDIRADEFLPELKGKRAIRTFREMRDNSAEIGAVMYATEQVLRDVEIMVVPSEADESGEYAKFVEEVFDDMEHTLDDHVAEALSALTYGFAWFEVVYKRRGGDAISGKKNSKYEDGKIGIRKLAIRSPWTIDKFVVDQQTGDVLGIEQEISWGKSREKFIPVDKSVYYRTTSLNADPSGRSILRNAYVPYTYLKNLQHIEAIAVERELHGIPVGRMPAEYLSPDATDDQRALRQSFETILRDLKRNEQGYALLPSDLYTDVEGKPTDQRLMDIELITSNGTRSIDMDPIIRRYQHDIARSVMAEFLMLGSSSAGSYALSKSKTDLYLRSMESYINSIVDVLNKQLIEPLWKMNGFDITLMPKLKAGDVAPHDLKELGSYLRNLNGADINLSDEVDIINALLKNAELPQVDAEKYLAKLEEKRQHEVDMALMAKPEPSEKTPVKPGENTPESRTNG